MKTTTRQRIKVDGNVRSTIITTTKTINWRRIPTNWQLPCGCIGPDIWTSDDISQSECTDCGRGWKRMTHICEMIDGQPQGKPVLVLTEKMIVNEDK